MTPQIVGFSGSPIPNSNTDRAVKAVLESTGLDYEFVKLSDLNVRPCRACKKCVPDNVCKQQDDFPKLAEKVKKASGLVIGAYTPYSQFDAFTKAFLERLWSLHHVNNLMEGKNLVLIITRCYPKMLESPILRHTGVGKLMASLKLPSEKVKNIVPTTMTMEGVNVIGTVTIKGNAPCLTCGYGEECKMSAMKGIHGKNATASAEYCNQVEDQQETWKKLQTFGTILGEESRASNKKQNGHRISAIFNSNR